MVANIIPFPVVEDQLCQYVAYLAREGLKAQSIKGYLSAIRYTQITQALGDPFEKPIPRLENVLKGSNSDQVQSRPGERTRLLYSNPRNSAGADRNVGERPTQPR